MLRPGKTTNGLPTNVYGAGAGGYGGSYGQGGGDGRYGGYSSSSYGASSGGAYDTYPTPAASPRHGVPRKGKSLDIASILKNKLVWAGVVALLFLGTTFYYRRQSSAILSKLHATSIDQAIGMFQQVEREKVRFAKEAQNLREAQARLKDTVRHLEAENRDLRKSKDELRVKYEGDLGTKALASEEELKLKAREEAWRKQVHVLQNATSRESAREAKARFGPGPHRVKFTIKIPNDPVEGDFVAEMASLDVMPHAVHLFLEQVYHGLWNNTFFYLNGPHVLQAGPQDWDDDSELGTNLKRFVDQQLDQLAFPEYNSSFPHLPWTIGFTGRPGGPDWYINKADNTIPHGPGGQFQHDLEEQADPCFAKIVEGQDTLQRIFRLDVFPTSDPYAYFFKEPVSIVSAIIINLNSAHLDLTSAETGKEPVHENVATASMPTDTAAKLADIKYHFNKNHFPLNP